jgi:hypothetical protein
VKQVQSQTASIESAVQQLDSEYAKLSGTITPEVFAARGFETEKAKIFISKTSTLGSISMAGNEL